MCHLFSMDLRSKVQTITFPSHTCTSQREREEKKEKKLKEREGCEEMRERERGQRE